MKQNIVLTNRKDHRIKFVLEPWAEEHTLDSGGELKLEIEADDVGDLEIVTSTDSIIVYLSEVSSCRIFIDKNLVSS